MNMAHHEMKSPIAISAVQAERERMRDALHNGIGQSLTSISFLASSLRQKLTARELPEADDAAEILALAGQAISEVQALVQDEMPCGLTSNNVVPSNPFA